jgi:hypothetical protein
MENKYTKSHHNLLIKSILIYMFLLCFSLIQVSVDAQSTTPLRRSISPSSPMWLIHIDTWNYPDPQKIIDLIPKDIRPYVVMNISLSISHDATTFRFKVAEYGYEIAKSWLKVCAQNQMWATVQVASGGMHQSAFSESDLSTYEEFFRDYPNFIGFNYAEQFWGFDEAPADPTSAAWTDRINHFADLLKLSNKYGGYLIVSWCGNQWGPNLNPIGMLKQNSSFAEACRKYTKNYILCEKYTQQSYISDVESTCLGAYLSGYSGQYGIRYDNTGWTDASGNDSLFTLATAGALHLEHVMLTGQTVIDGPEIIWINCFKESNKSTTTDSYTRRNWATYAHFDNVMVEIFRKILDGTVRIPTRKEVIDRTKFVIINDVSSGTSDSIYSSPKSLFQGLYRMDGDGNLSGNKTPFKKTGRYPTIPTVYKLADTKAQSFAVQVNKSNYAKRWPTIAAKVNEFDTIFPKEYTGNLYVGRNENGWVTYNPYKVDTVAYARIPFKYNTCDSMALAYSQYTAGVVKEYADKVTFFLSNYDDEVKTGLKSDTIWIYGSSSEPTWSYVEKGNHQASTITENWSNSLFYLAIAHNGAVDITVNCSGAATGRLTTYTTATLTAPSQPALYTGARQYEAECFDYKNVASVVTGGYSGDIRKYTGQGYIKFGTDESASIRDTVNALKTGVYQLKIRYMAPKGDVNNVDLYVNGSKVSTPAFVNTDSTWTVNVQTITLNAGDNSIVLQANAAGANNIIFDNILITQGNSTAIYDFTNDTASSSAKSPAAALISVQSGTAGVVSYADANNNTSNCFKTYSVGDVNGTGVADLDMFPSSALNYYIVWKGYYGTTGGEKGVLLRGTGSNGSCSYAAGLKQGYLFTAQNNKDNTVTLKTYIADKTGLTSKSSYTTKFQVLSNKPCWYRAMAVDSALIFECSSDSVTWVGGSSTAFTDTTYIIGSTELVWGLGSSNFDWTADNIAYLKSDLSASNYALSGFTYTYGSGPSSIKSFSVSGTLLTDSILITSPANYEISLDSLSGYTSTLTLDQTAGMVSSTKVYVRLKSGLALSSAYDGAITVSSNQMSNFTVNLSGTVTPATASKIYDFSSDVAGTSATTPPALNTTIGSNNGCTAGVVSYTDSKGVTSNMFTAYTAGTRNGTGIVNLNLFSRKSTDYSVTWKQCYGTLPSSKTYKSGVVLRGDTSKVGNASDTAYTAGMMYGYVFIAYPTSSGTQFRIYPSTKSTSLSAVVNTTVSTLIPTAGQPVWFRASATGSSSVVLKFEYSTDSVTWATGSSYTDASYKYASGATQIIWGLNGGSFDFYMDNIIFEGIEAGLPTAEPVLIVSTDSLRGFSCYKNYSPSDYKEFTISGYLLTDSVKVAAPSNYEISLNPLAGYGSTCTLVPDDGNLAVTTIYVRLKSGLDISNYIDSISIASTGFTTKKVALSGSVIEQPVITVNPSALSGFDYVVGAGPSTDQSFTVTGSSLFDNIAVYAPENYEISLNDGSGYTTSVSLAPNSGQISATPVYVRLKSGLPVDFYNEAVFGSATGVANQTLDVSGSVTPVVYTITASAGDGGSINPSGEVSVEEGSNQSFTITANTGYHIVDVLVDGSSEGAVSTYTFSSVAANHTIVASFAETTVPVYTITASAGEGGNISPLGQVSVEEGSSQIFTITANTGYVISDVLADGTSVGAISSYTFSSVAANHTIAASFTAGTGIENTLATEPSIYPNPVTNTLHVANASGRTLKVYNLLGTELLIKTMKSDDESINVSAWPYGVYVVKVNEKDFKLIK